MSGAKVKGVMGPAAATFEIDRLHALCATYRASIAELEAKAADAAEQARGEEREAKDAAYLERNQCVALLASMALALGHRAGITRTDIEGWEPEWHNCVYIDLPAGQISWHYHDKEARGFGHLPPYEGEWDGHDTPLKYERVWTEAANITAAIRARTSEPDEETRTG